MYKKSKGTTLIEVLVSVSLIAIVLIFVFNILADLKNEYSLASKRSEDAIARASYTRIIQNDFIAKELTDVTTCSNGGNLLLCMNFKYKDGTTKRLEVYKTYVVYDDEKWSLSVGEYTLNDAMICYKNISNIIDSNKNSLSTEKYNELKQDIAAGKVDEYHLLKIYLPASANASTNKKYNFELVHISPYKLNVTINGYTSINGCK